MLKATGIIRNIDDMGRVVIPKELRRVMNIENGDPLEIFTDEAQIILKKYQPGCVFCGRVENTISHGGKTVCNNCILDLKKQAKLNEVISKK